MDIPTDLSGLNEAQARQYLLDHGVTLKLTEKRLEEVLLDFDLWQNRVSLANQRAEPELARAAEAELAVLAGKRDQLSAEAAELRALIKDIRRQLPGLAARQRSIDPDLLEQELLIAAGRLPGDEDKAAAERRLAELERHAGADEALEALKAKMGLAPANQPPETADPPLNQAKDPSETTEPKPNSSST